MCCLTSITQRPAKILKGIVINIEASDKPALAMEKFCCGAPNTAGGPGEESRFVFHGVLLLSSWIENEDCKPLFSTVRPGAAINNFIDG